jgi:hypothetical protein
MSIQNKRELYGWVLGGGCEGVIEDRGLENVVLILC